MGKQLYLCGDLGGTKALMGIAHATNSAAEATDGPLTFYFRKQYSCNSFSRFEDLFAQFQKDARQELGSAALAEITGGVLAIAGPIADDGYSGYFTNLNWQVDMRSAHAQWAQHHARIALVNDLYASAAGVTVAMPKTQLQLRVGMPLENGVRLVIGAGTGLNMATLIRNQKSRNDGGSWIILSGEYGHLGFSPQDETGITLHKYFQKLHGRVIWEHLVSGSGIAAIHCALSGKKTTAEIITAAALTGDEECMHSCDVFMSAYGAFCGDMAMALLARGGIYLVGGIAGKMQNLMMRPAFLTAFDNKAEFTSLTHLMPVTLINDPAIGLRGAAALAMQLGGLPSLSIGCN